MEEKSRLPQEAMLRQLEQADLAEAARFFYDVQALLQRRIYAIKPRYKQEPDTTHSFQAFVRARLDGTRPVRLLDLGCHDAYLAASLAEGLHPASRLDGVDTIRQPTLCRHPNLTFHEADILTWIEAEPRPIYDYVVLGAVLTLFDDRDRARLLDFLAGHARHLFVREGPRYASLIEIHFDALLDDWRHYRLLSETQLKTLLVRHGFALRTVEHEFDIYVHACSRTLVPNTPDGA